MKRIIAAVLVALLALGLCACGGSAEKADIRQAKSIADLAGAKIGAQAGTFHADALTQIKDVQGSTLPEFTDLLIALKSGAIDGYIAEKPTALSVCEGDAELTYLPFKNNDTGFTATPAQVGIAVGVREASALKDAINGVLAGISEETRQALMEQMVSAANGGVIASLALDCPEPTEYIGTLKVAMECAYEPFNWTETQGKTPGAVPISGEGKDGLYANGYDVQVARYVANKLGYRLEIYAMEWDSLVPAVQSGTVDAIVAGMSPTEEREQEIDFTDCYYESDLVVIIKK